MRAGEEQSAARYVLDLRPGQHLRIPRRENAFDRFSSLLLCDEVGLRTVQEDQAIAEQGREPEDADA